MLSGGKRFRLKRKIVAGLRGRGRPFSLRMFRSAQTIELPTLRACICNLDERAANLTLLSLLNKVPIGRKNLSENIVLAHPNRKPCSRVLVRWRPELGVQWK